MSKNARKREKNATGSRFYPTYSVIKKHFLEFSLVGQFSRVFLAFSLAFFILTMLVKNVKKNARKLPNARILFILEQLLC